MKPRVSGLTYRRNPDNSIGPPIADVQLTFIREDLGEAPCRARSDARGRYEVSLSAGRYFLRATHEDYEDDSSIPGVLVATDAAQTCNFFLRAPCATTAIVLRHADKVDADPNDLDPPLSALGDARAAALRDALYRAGITAIYVTGARRTKATAAPLARALCLTPKVMDDPEAVAADVLAHHRGDVVLVVAHSPTVTRVATALGAPANVIGEVGGYDNMFVVSVTAGAVGVVNLQYGAGSAGDAGKNFKRFTTLLLVGQRGTSAEPEQLLHAARAAKVEAIYAAQAKHGMVTPLAGALGLAVRDYADDDVAALCRRLVADHPRSTVVISGTHETHRALVRGLGASPFPILYPNDVDHLVVVTLAQAGAARVVAMRL